MNLLSTMAHRSLAVLLATTALLAQAATATAPATAPADTPTASLWSRLWRTPDQRGQALLQQGDAAGAALAFADPEHKAHAALQARDYPGAAKTLSGIDSAEAHYNRGNALAHAGDLPGSIQAYDAALKHNPQHTDARHNRDIVAAALQKQKDDKKDSNQQDKQGKEDSKAGDKSGDKQLDKDNKDGKPDSKPGDGKDGKPADKSESKQDEKSGSKPNDKPGNKADKQLSAKPGEQPASAPQPSKAPAAPATAASSPKDDAAQARRDAEAALGKGAQQQPPAPAHSGVSAPVPGLAGAQDAGKLPPMTEKQIAQDQWLRAIPDDPGGLLRRKFMIQHMLRQQGQKP